VTLWDNSSLRKDNLHLQSNSWNMQLKYICDPAYRRITISADRFAAQFRSLEAYAAFHVAIDKCCYLRCIYIVTSYLTRRYTHILKLASRMHSCGYLTSPKPDVPTEPIPLILAAVICLTCNPPFPVRI